MSSRTVTIEDAKGGPRDLHAYLGVPGKAVFVDGKLIGHAHSRQGLRRVLTYTVNNYGVDVEEAGDLSRRFGEGLIADIPALAEIVRTKEVPGEDEGMFGFEVCTNPTCADIALGIPHGHIVGPYGLVLQEVVTFTDALVFLLQPGPRPIIPGICVRILQQVLAADLSLDSGALSDRVDRILEQVLPPPVQESGAPSQDDRGPPPGSNETPPRRSGFVIVRRIFTLNFWR